MALVRNAQATSLVRDAIVLDLGDLARQGDALRAKAQAEADQLIADGKAERARLIAEADAKGHAEGLARGLEEGRITGSEEGRAQAYEETRNAMGSLSESWAQAFDMFEKERKESRKNAEHELLTLAANIIRRIIHRVVEMDESIVQDQLSKVLLLVLEPTGIVIEVHPEDIEACNKVLPGLIDGQAESTELQVRGRSDLVRGSVVVRTRGGEIDASVDGQIDRVIETMALSPLSPAQPERE